MEAPEKKAAPARAADENGDEISIANFDLAYKPIDVSAGLHAAYARAASERWLHDRVNALETARSLHRFAQLFWPEVTT